MRTDVLLFLSNIHELIATEEPGRFTAEMEIDIYHVDNIFARLEFYDFIWSIIPSEVKQYWWIDFYCHYRSVYNQQHYVFNMTAPTRVQHPLL